MVERDRVVHFLEELLSVHEFEDYCVNGLQVEGKRAIRKIALGVSVSGRLFEAAISWNADMIIVHHGLFWKSDPHPFALRGIQCRRLAFLIRHEINLLGYHLPLDAHPEIGNNVQLLKRLELDRGPAVDVGFLGLCPAPMRFDAFVKRVNQCIGTEAQVFPYGSDRIEKVGIISGGSSPEYRKVVEAGADTFVGGDIRENVVRELEEAEINYINAGHYNTEKFGIQALGGRIREAFDIELQFIDIPNAV